MTVNNELLAGRDLWFKLVGEATSDDDFPFPCRVAATPTAVKVSEALKLPSGSGRSPAAKRVLVHFEVKMNVLNKCFHPTLSLPPPFPFFSVPFPYLTSLAAAKRPYLRLWVFRAIAACCG